MSPKPAAVRRYDHLHFDFRKDFLHELGHQVSTALQPHEVCSVAPLSGESDEVFLDCVRSSGMTPFLSLT